MSDSHLHHANFFATSQTVSCIVGFEGSFRQVNQATLDVLGYRLEEILHLSFAELVEDSEKKRIETLLEALSESDSAMTFTASFRCKDGIYREFLWQATPSLMEFAFYAVGIDVTTCKQNMEQVAVEELRESYVILQEKYADLQLMYEELQERLGGEQNAEQAQHYPTVIDTMREGVAIQGRNGKLNLLNPQRVQEILGETLGLSDFMTLWQVASRGEEQSREPAIHRLHKQDKSIHLQCSARVIKDPQTQSTQARLLVFHDVSREIHLAKQIHALQDDMATITHAQKEGVLNWELRQGRIDYSPSWKSMLGLAENENLGRNENAWFSRIHPNDYKQVSSEVKHFLKVQQGKLDLKYRMQHKDGSYRWVHNTGRLIPEGAQAQRFIGVFMDITEQQQVQQSLQSTKIKAEKEAFYHHLFTAQGEAALVFSQEERRVIDINPLAVKLYGYAREDWKDGQLGKIYADPAQCIADAQLASKQQHTHIPLSWHKRKNGTVFPVEINIGHCELRRQKLFYATLRDITERHAREQVLREERNQYGTIFHASPFMILCVDRNGQILRANRQAAKILNSRPEMLESQSLRELKLAYDKTDEAFDQHVLSSGQAVLGKLKEIEAKRWQFNRLPYRDAAGNVIGLILFIIDVSTFD